MFGPSPTIPCYHPRWQMLVGVEVQKPPTSAGWHRIMPSRARLKPGTRADLPPSSVRKESHGSRLDGRHQASPTLLGRPPTPSLQTRAHPFPGTPAAVPGAADPEKEEGGGERRGWRKRCQARRPQPPLGHEAEAEAGGRLRGRCPKPRADSVARSNRLTLHGARLRLLPAGHFHSGYCAYSLLFLSLSLLFFLLLFLLSSPLASLSLPSSFASCASPGVSACPPPLSFFSHLETLSTGGSPAEAKQQRRRPDRFFDFSLLCLLQCGNLQLSFFFLLFFFWGGGGLFCFKQNT